MIEPWIVEEYFEDLQRSWQQVFSQWPLGIQPHFISYEEIFQNGHSWNPTELAERLGVNFTNVLNAALRQYSCAKKVQT